MKVNGKIITGILDSKIKKVINSTLIFDCNEVFVFDSRCAINAIKRIVKKSSLKKVKVEKKSVDINKIINKTITYAYLNENNESYSDELVFGFDNDVELTVSFADSSFSVP